MNELAKELERLEARDLREKVEYLEDEIRLLENRLFDSGCPECDPTWQI